jgi:hypothetical protein
LLQEGNLTTYESEKPAFETQVKASKDYRTQNPK